MKQYEVRNLFDDEYAAAYDQNYLLGENFRECTELELSIVKQLLVGGQSWLDVACGTGYFLSRLPDVERAGLDLSPAMLGVARRANPGVLFYEHDFRDEFGDLRDRWDLVSCMWYAYCYAESMDEIHRVIRNLASWTSPCGACFLPVCDPEAVCKIDILYPRAAHGDLRISGVIWTWTDMPSGKYHRDLLAPRTEYLLEMFREFFNDVAVVTYPAFAADHRAARKAIIARGKFGFERCVA
jgi:SAM-dependent methyltransferase